LKAALGRVSFVVYNGTAQEVAGDTIHSVAGFDPENY